MKKILHYLTIFMLLVTIALPIKIVNAEETVDQTKSSTYAIKSISFKKQHINMPDSNVAYVTINSNVSNLKKLHIDYGNRINADKSPYTAECTLTKTKLVYECPISIPKFEESGTWKIYGIVINTNDDQQLYYYYTDDPTMLKWPTFSVTNSNEDYEPPVLHSFEVLGDVLQPGVDFQVAVNAEDRISKIKDIIVIFHNIRTDERVFLRDFKNTGNNIWIATANLPKSADIGDWQVDLVNLRDNAGNAFVRFYSPTGYQEQTTTSQNVVTTNTVKTNNIESFKVLANSKVLATTRSSVKMQSFSNRTIEIFNGKKLLKKVQTKSNGIGNVTFKKQAKNTSLKAIVKMKSGKVTETVKFKLPKM